MFKNNMEYRKYLQTHATKIMIINQQQYNNTVAINTPISSINF